MVRSSSWRIAPLVFTMTFGLMIGLAQAQVVFPERSRLNPEINNPDRKKLGKATTVSQELYAKPKGARGKARKPKKFKKLTIADFKKLADKAAKKKGARGKTSKKAKAFLKTLNKKGKIVIEKRQWAGTGKGRKGSRGAKAPKMIKKELTQEQFLAEINKLEKQANAKGYSLLDDDREVKTGFVTNERAMKQQANALNGKGWGKVRPLEMPKKPRFAGVKLNTGSRGKNSRSRLRMLTSKNSFKVKKAKKGARGAKKKKKPIKLYKKEKKDEVTYGNKKLASVGFGYRFYTEVNTEGAKADAKLTGDIHLFKKKFSVFRADANLSGKVKGKQTKAKLTAKVLGVEKAIINHDSAKKGSRGKKKALWSKGDRKVYEKEVSHKIHFMLAFIPVKVEVGAAFAAGVEYKLSLNPTSVSATLTPFINADGFARLAISILIADVGIEGRITLLDLELRIQGEGGVSMEDKKGIYAYAYFAGDLALEALAGKLSVYALVDLGFWDKKFSHTIFKFAGIGKTWRLFELKDEFPLLGGTEEQKKAAKKNTGPSKEAKGGQCDEGVPGFGANKKACVIALPYQIKKDCSKKKCDRYRFVSQKGKKIGMIAYRSKSRKKVFKRIYECKEGEQRSRAKNSSFDGLGKNQWCIFWSGKLKNGKRLKHASKCPGPACPYRIDHQGLIYTPPKPLTKAKRHGAPVGITTTKKKNNKSLWRIEKAGVDGWYRFQSVHNGKYLHIEKGRVELGSIDKSWWSAMWRDPQVGAGPYRHLQNRWKTDRYIHNQFGRIEATNLESLSWWSAMWTVEKIKKKGYVRLKNRWKKTYLSAK